MPVADGMARMVVAVDVDGTLYDGTHVAHEAVVALRRAADAGHVIVVVTGRPWCDLGEVIGEVLPVLRGAVCEGGAVLADPATQRQERLGQPIDARYAEALVRAGVPEVVAGTVMVGAPASALPLAVALVGRLGGDVQVVRNKGSIALLPSGCDKGTGLRQAVSRLGLSAVPILAIGDAENDLPMFAVADVAVAVAGADDAVRAAGVTILSNRVGAGVAEALAPYLPQH